MSNFDFNPEKLNQVIYRILCETKDFKIYENCDFNEALLKVPDAECNDNCKNIVQKINNCRAK